MPLSGARVLVVGLGVSGAAAARALLGAGARVRVVDSGRGPGLQRQADGLAGLGAEVTLAPDPDVAALLAGCDLVVASPGVAPDGPLLGPAVASGVPVWSEPELAWRLAGGRTRLVGVTGTNGKTSTTELLATCLGVPAAGNIGTPLVSLLAGEQPPALAVAELSSFQLEFCHALRTQVGVLLNLAPDHLDRHGSLAAYGAAKARIWARQQPGDWAVVGADDAGAAEVAAAHPPPAGRAGFTLGPPRPAQAGVLQGVLVWRDPDGALHPVVSVDDLQARGRHNLANAAAAVAAAVCAGADPGALGPPLAAYRPGAHRLELVATVDGVAWVNDSKATNPHAAAAALDSFERVVWIAGGLNKGLDFAELAPRLRERVRATVTIGTSGPEIAALARSLGVPTVEAGTLDCAVAEAAAAARPGDVVLLAPACASMDQFTDYAARGQAFRDLVAALPGKAGSRRG